MSHQFTPEIGSITNTSVCSNLKGETFTAEFQSFFANNVGSNPVNALLTLWNSGTSFSSPSSISDTSPCSSSALRWYLESAPWVIYAKSSTTQSDSPCDSVSDIFNLTLSPDTKETPYKMTGSIKNADKMLDKFEMDLESCNTAIETKHNSISLVDRDWSNNAGWNWT
ncbi:hypothetical protein N7490_003121 [Penicillium lividum]|nr:hypothetical protein N7490_003121 [Penicillium lividum]